MSPSIVPTRPGRRQARFRLLLLFLLLVGLVVPVAQAQESNADTPNPTDEELALEPRVLSETRDGDATTITIEIPVGSDTFTASGRPTTNFSTDSFLRVGFNN